MMASILHTELERKVEKHRHMKLVVMQPKINYKSELPERELNKPDQSTWSVIAQINWYRLSFENKGGGEGGLKGDLR